MSALRRALLPLAMLAGAALAPPAHAATLTVSSTADAGAGSLRAALAAAAPGDVVAVPAGTYLLTSKPLEVPALVRVNGAGARRTTISGGDAMRVLDVTGGGASLSDLTITRGYDAGSGGGIRFAAGGTLRGVAVVGNVSGTGGGGVHAAGSKPLVLEDSLVSGNTAASGGGLRIETTVASRITGSTITANTATSDAGGGLWVAGGPLLLEHATVVANGAKTVGGNLLVRPATTVSMRSTALGEGTAVAGGNCALGAGATLTSLGHNAQDADAHPQAACQQSFTATDRLGAPLQLDALGDDGGPVDSRTPLPGSPLLDAADPGHCLPDDLRSVPRPQGAGCDIGAIERSTPSVSATTPDVVMTNRAVIRATLNAQRLLGSARVIYGPTAAGGTSTASFGLSPVAQPQAFVAQLYGLEPSTTYHARVEITTPDGTVAGEDTTFTTAAAPVAVPPVLVPQTPETEPEGPTIVQRRRAVRAGVVRLTLACRGLPGETCRGEATLCRASRSACARAAVLFRRPASVVGSRRFAIPAGKQREVRVGLGRAGQRALRRRGRLAVRATVTVDVRPGFVRRLPTSALLPLTAARRR